MCTSTTETDRVTGTTVLEFSLLLAVPEIVFLDQFGASQVSFSPCVCVCVVLGVIVPARTITYFSTDGGSIGHAVSLIDQNKILGEELIRRLSLGRPQTSFTSPCSIGTVGYGRRLAGVDARCPERSSGCRTLRMHVLVIAGVGDVID